MFNIFKKKLSNFKLPFLVDIHSHLLPGLDDGVKSFEESLVIIKAFKRMGYEKLITTPHVMSDYYQNNPENIKAKLDELKVLIREEGLDIGIDAAAEYYLDENLLDKLEKKEPLLTFGENYLLFETSFLNMPAFLKEAIFLMNVRGYQPVLAHPERYVYMQNNLSLSDELHNMNLHYQLNLLSLFNYYSKEVRKFAQYLLNKEMISFIGSDCHNLNHLAFIENKMDKKTYKTLTSLELLNQDIK